MNGQQFFNAPTVAAYLGKYEDRFLMKKRLVLPIIMSM